MVQQMRTSILQRLLGPKMERMCTMLGLTIVGTHIPMYGKKHTFVVLFVTSEAQKIGVKDVTFEFAITVGMNDGTNAFNAQPSYSNAAPDQKSKYVPDQTLNCTFAPNQKFNCVFGKVRRKKKLLILGQMMYHQKEPYWMIQPSVPFHPFQKVD